MNLDQIQKAGINLSDMTDGDGLEIMQIAIYALTDVNYHQEAKIINELLANAEGPFNQLELIQKPRYRSRRDH